MMHKWQALLAQLEVFDRDGSNTLTEEELLAFEKKTGIILPAEYKKFCQVFGPGCVGEFISIFSPTSSPQFFLDTIKYEVADSPRLPLEELEKNMKVEVIVSLVENAFVFGGDGATHIVFFTLRTYSESDSSCDIYWATCPDFDGEIYCIGRDFFEFVRDFCLGTKCYGILPLSMCASPCCIVHTFTRFAPPTIDPQQAADFFRQNDELVLEIKRQDDSFKAKLNQIESVNPEQAANLFSSNLDPFKARLIAQLKEFVPITPQQEAELFSRNIDEFINEYMAQMGQIPATSDTAELRFNEDFGHLHLPSEYVRDHSRSDRLSEAEDYEVTLQAIRDNNPYAFFRYVKTLKGHSGSVYAITFIPDGLSLASGSSDRTIKLWDLSTYREIRTLKGHEDAVVSLVASPDGKTLISGSADTTIKLWNLSTGQTTHTLRGHTHSVLCQAISPDGKYLASGSADTTIRLWDLNTHQAIHTLRGHGHTVLSIAISPDGKTLASASADTTVKLWDLRTGEVLRTLEANSGLVFAVHFHPSGQMLVSIHDEDKTIKQWHLHTREVVRTISTDIEIVSAAVSPDWKTLAGGGGNTSYLIGLWDLETGKGINYFHGFGEVNHNGCVYSVAFSPNGQLLASGSKDTTIKLWGIPPPLNIE